MTSSTARGGHRNPPAQDVSRAIERHPRLSKVQEWVHSNIDKRISLSAAANIAGLERCYFSRVFRATVGVCFRDWLRATRVSRAAELLTRPHASVFDVALQVGYRNPRTFERAFKKVVGLTPSTYRARSRFE